MMRIFRWSSGLMGVSLMAFAGWGILHERGYTAPVGLAVWLAAGVGLHDFVLAPLLLLAGALVFRVVPDRLRTVVAVGLVTIGTLLLVGVPVAVAARRPRANPSILPLDYWRGLALSVSVVVVLTVGVALGVTIVGSLRRSPVVPEEPPD